MSDYDDDTDGTDSDDGRNPLRAQLRKLEREVKEWKGKYEAAAPAERRLAFVEAGVDLKAPGAKYFIKGYDGDLTADAIKAAAIEEGFLKSDPKDVLGDAEKAGLAEIDRASTGGAAPGQLPDLQAQMAALPYRTDLSPAQQKAELDKLVTQAGLMPTG